MVRLWSSGPSQGGNGRSWSRALLRGWFRRAELVELCARRFCYQPERFRWRGLLHKVRRIEGVWEQAGSGNRPARRYFRVACHDNTIYTLFQDLSLGSWYVEV